MPSTSVSSAVTESHEDLALYRLAREFHRRLKRLIQPAARAVGIRNQVVRASFRAMVHIGEAIYGTEGEAKRRLQAAKRWYARVIMIVDELHDDGEVDDLALERVRMFRRAVLGELQHLARLPRAEWLLPARVEQASGGHESMIVDEFSRTASAPPVGASGEGRWCPITPSPPSATGPTMQAGAQPPRSDDGGETTAVLSGGG
jgi:hypothetical protein